MQTFVPYNNVIECALVLDDKRLGKQRVEVLQILRANLGLTKGWVNHPASRMWKGHEGALVTYGVAMCNAWILRGFKDTCREKILELATPDRDFPEWWGRDDIMLSHQSNLVRKFPEHYKKYFPEVLDNLPYVWIR